MAETDIRPHLSSKRNSGFTLLEIVIVVGIIAVVAAIAIPNMLHAREKSHASICFANRQALTRAEQLFYANTNRHSYSIDELRNADLYHSAVCPKAGVYFWLDFEPTSDLYQAIMGCSIHAVSTTEEENEIIFERILASDDFSAGMEAWSKIYGSWRVENGALVAPTGQYSLLLRNDKNLTNNTIKVDVNFQNPQSSAGIVFRATASGTKLVTGYGLEIDRGRNAFIYTEIVNGKYIELDKAPIPKGFDWSATHTMEVKAENDRFVLYVDGKEVLATSDQQFTVGQVGLYADKQVKFDNFEVREIDEKK